MQHTLPEHNAPSIGQSVLNAANAHRVWLVIALILLALAVIDPTQATASCVFLLKALLSTGPFLLLSISFAAYAAASNADSMIARAFSGSPLTMILLAALLGGLSPFCSCGVIPLIASLLAMGVPLAPVMAFWLASPVIDPAMFVMTSGLIGVEFAVAKTLAAVALGLFGGLVTLTLARFGLLTNPLRPGVGSGCGGQVVTTPGKIVWQFWQDRQRRQKFFDVAITTMLFLLKWLALAFVLESLMLAYVPADLISSLLGGTGLQPIITATVVGVPAYLNGYAALPLISGLIEQGMLPGAGLAFIVAGGVTSVPAAIAVFALVRVPVFILYIVLALIGSVASGVAYQAWQG